MALPQRLTKHKQPTPFTHPTNQATTYQYARQPTYKHTPNNIEAHAKTQKTEPQTQTKTKTAAKTQTKQPRQHPKNFTTHILIVNSLTGNQNMNIEIENLKKDTNIRNKTDTHMTTWWTTVYLIPIIATITWAIIFIAALIAYIITLFQLPPTTTEIPPFPLTAELAAATTGLYIAIIASFILFIILTYKLIKRRNHHFKRQILLFEDITATIKKAATKKEIDTEYDIGTLERTLKEIKAEETESEKSTMLWTILATINPLALLYVWYFLMKDFHKHEKREDTLWTQVSQILNKTGIKLETPTRTDPLLERSFALYLILTIITLGLFGIYWLYTLLKDPNTHFTHHTKIEDQILPILENTLA